MNDKNTKGLLISGFFWRFAERCGAQIVSLLVSIVLARLLTPDEYGTISLVLVFITILQVFVDSGFGNALIQKKDADDLDFSTVFFFNVVMCCFIYIGIWLLAPFISEFYNDKSLVPIIRAVSTIIILSGMKNVQQAYVSRHLLFKKFFFSTLIGTIASALVGIVFAYNGYGVWALVAQYITNAFIDMLVLWITVGWRPSFCFSFVRLKGLFSFGWKLLISSLLDVSYNQLRNLIIGKLYTEADLAFYNQGDKFPKIIVTNINASVDSVLLPAMSNAQDDINRVKMMTRRSIKTSVYILAPLMLGMCCIAEPMVRIIFTEKWLPCVPYLRIFCITYIFYPIHTANLNAIKALGRSDLFLKLEIIKKITGFIILIITMRMGVMIMAYSLLLTSLLSQIINAWPNRKLLGYRYYEQIRDILPCMGLAILMTCLVYPISKLCLPDILIVCIQIIVGILAYMIGSVLLKLEVFQYILNTLKGILKSKVGRRK